MTLIDLIEEVNFLLSLIENQNINIHTIEIKDQFGNIILIK